MPALERRSARLGGGPAGWLEHRLRGARRIAAGPLPLLAPVHLLLVSVIVVPACYVAWLSLTSSTYGRAPRFVGLANYTTVLTDPYFWRALWHTLIITVVVVHVELIVGLGMALLFASGLPGRRVLLAATLAPYAVSEVTAVVIWRFLFDPDIGPITLLLHHLGLPGLDWTISPFAGLAIVALLSIWLNLPFTFVILYAARLALPSQLYEAARVDGATRLQQFRHVTLPLLTPAMLIAVLFRYIIAFRLFTEVWLMTGGGPARSTEVLAVYLYLNAFSFDEFGQAAATGWLMVIFSLLLALFYLYALRRQMIADAA